MKKLIAILLILAVAGTYFFVNSKKADVLGSVDSEAELILFWGEGCPHCEKVKDYIKANNLDSKIKIASKEVYLDKNNQKLLTETVQKCPEIDSSRGVGVPLAFDVKNNLCLYGDTPIIEWLQAKWYNLSVSKKLKHREFHFSLGVLFRWVIFALIIYFSINYLSKNSSSTHLPHYSTTNLNILGISTEPVIIKATETFENYKKQVVNFFNEQIVDLKKQIVTKVYDDVIKSIENKPWF